MSGTLKKLKVYSKLEAGLGYGGQNLWLREASLVLSLTETKFRLAEGEAPEPFHHIPV